MYFRIYLKGYFPLLTVLQLLLTTQSINENLKLQDLLKTRRAFIYSYTLMVFVIFVLTEFSTFIAGTMATKIRYNCE